MSKYISLRIEPRWPCFAVGFARPRRFAAYRFNIIVWCFVLEIGDLS